MIFVLLQVVFTLGTGSDKDRSMWTLFKDYMSTTKEVYSAVLFLSVESSMCEEDPFIPIESSWNDLHVFEENG